MTPRFTGDNLRDYALPNAVLASELPLRDATSGVSLPYLSYLLLIQYGVTLPLSTRNALRVQTASVAVAAWYAVGMHLRAVAIASCRSLRLRVLAVAQTSWATAFLVHVTHVVALCAKKQVGRVAACAHVAGVTDQEAVRDRAIGQLPGNTVGTLGCVLGRGELPVSIWESTRSPQPTVAGFIDLRPKPFSERGGILGVHIDLQSMCRALTVAAVQGFAMPSIIASQSHKLNTGGRAYA
jgi:hypothetical protein